MGRRRSASLFGSGIIPATLLTKLLLGAIAAGCVAAEGPFLAPAAETGEKRLRGVDSGGGPRFPAGVSDERDSPRSWTYVEEGASGPSRDLSGTVAFDDRHRRVVTAPPRTVTDATAEWEAEGGDVRVVTGRVMRADSMEERSPEVVVDGEPEEAKEAEKKRMPRILTVLTTYNKRSLFVKAYKQAVRDRSDGYRPTVFVVSDQEDDDPERVIDYKVGSPRRHRTLAAIREACARYEGKFDWLALGDDDTVFMYNRIGAFLSHIDHTQPVVFGKVDGLNPTASPCYDRECFTPEQKGNASDLLASQGCCDDFTHPCKVPVYPEHPEIGRLYGYQDYGPGGLFWPFGGSGTLVSAGLVETVVGGAQGWARCALVFGHMNTDVQFAQCLKTHGYSMGSYRDGFTQMETADPVLIREALAADCQVMGVHIGIRHLADGSNYTMESFGDAVAAVRDEDEAWTGAGADLPDMCPKAWAAISKWS